MDFALSEMGRSSPSFVLGLDSLLAASPIGIQIDMSCAKRGREAGPVPLHSYMVGLGNVGNAGLDSTHAASVKYTIMSRNATSLPDMLCSAGNTLRLSIYQIE